MSALYPSKFSACEQTVLSEIERRSGTEMTRGRGHGENGRSKGGLVAEVGTSSSHWELLRRESLFARGCVAVLISPTNLRVNDNYPLSLALEKAIELNVPLIPIFVFDGRLFAQPSSTAGFFRRSPERARFLIESVNALRHSLEHEQNVPLLIRTGYPEFIVPDLCRTLNAKALFASTQYAPHEQLIEESIRQQLKEGPKRKAAPSTASDKYVPIPFHTVWDSTLVHSDDFLTPLADLPESLQWFLEDWHQQPIRPTGPYNCGDGRIRAHHDALASFLSAGGLATDATAGHFEEDGADQVYSEAFVDELSPSEPEPTPTPSAHFSKVPESLSLASAEVTAGRALSPIPLIFLPSAAERSFYVQHINSPSTRCDSHGIVPNAVRGAVPTLEDLGYKSNCESIPSIHTHRLGDVPFVGGEQNALARFDEWVALGGPKSYIKPGRSFAYATEMSKHTQLRISPWLAHGCISPRTLLERHRQLAQDAPTTGMAGQWYQESKQRLGRRDFWHFMGLRYGRALFFPYGPRPENTNSIPDWKMDDKIIKRWCHGLTGIPFADGAMRELVTSGFVASEGRQGLAWLLTRGYGQDWRVGAEWFERCSLDYDPFVNYGQFAYFSQLISDDFSDIVRDVNYLAHKVDQSGLYVKAWVPEVSKLPAHYIHRPHVLTERMQKIHNVHLGATYPYPVKLWDGAHLQLSADKLTSYFPSAEQAKALADQGGRNQPFLSLHKEYRGWQEAHTYGTRVLPADHSPLAYLSV